MIKEKCPICGIECNSISTHFGVVKDEKHLDYIKNKIYPKLDDYLLAYDLSYNEIKNELENQGIIVSHNLIHRRSKEICPERGYELRRRKFLGDSNPAKRKDVREKISEDKKGDLNPAKRIEVRQKISNTVAQHWKYGTYNERENGMLGKLGKLNPAFNVYNWLKNRYIQIYKFYHNDELKCSYPNCPKTIENNIINIHHIDEDRSNFLISNLEALCVFHHTDKHYGSRKTEFITVTKRFSFDSSHNLLDYDGKCAQLHGHTYFLEVSIRKRIDLHTGMVIDFGDLKSIVKKYILDKLDHNYINDVIPYLNPTAENMVHWIWEVLEKDALLKGLDSIRLWETPDCHVELTKEGIYKSPLYVLGYYQEMYEHWGWEKENKEPLIVHSKEEDK